TMGPFDPLIQAPRFSKAGNSFPYSPDPAHPGLALPPNFLERACSDANFMDGIIQQVIDEVADFISSNGAAAGGILAGVTLAGGGAALAALIPALALLLALLVALLAALRAAGPSRFGQVMNDVRATLLSNPDPNVRRAGVLV